MMPIPDGVYAAAVTPRRLGLQDINLGVMWDLIDFLCDRGVDGLVLLGNTGEFIHYSNAERMRMMGLAPRRSKVPVLINASHSNLDGAVELAQAAAASGAAGVLIMPPVYYRYGSDAIRTFLLRFVEESDISIPILLYNLPESGNPIPPGVATELLRQGAVHGIKDSSCDPELLKVLLELRQSQNFTLFAGDEIFYSASWTPGFSGVVSGTASALPELIAALARARRSGAPDAEALHRRLVEFNEWAERLPVPVAVREACCLRGLKIGPGAIPPSPEQETVLAEFRAWFPGWLKTVLGESRAHA